MTFLELRDKKVDKLAELLKQAGRETCTCYDDPEGPCKKCTLYMKASRIYEELTEQ